MDELMPCNLQLLNDRILNLDVELLRMPENGMIQASKAFLTNVRNYMCELLAMRREEENRRTKPENPTLTLEQFEKVCETVHNGWWEECKRQGRENHPDMIPYEQLSEPVKEYDRVTVSHVLDALNIAYRHKPEVTA